MAKRPVRLPGKLVEPGPKVFVRPIDRMGARISEAATKGEHLWAHLAVFETRDPTQREGVHLDTENLLSIEGPGCLICERPFDPSLLGTRCPGEPRA